MIKELQISKYRFSTVITFLYCLFWGVLCNSTFASQVSNLSIDNKMLISDCKIDSSDPNQQLHAFKDFILNSWNNVTPYIGDPSCLFSKDIPRILITFRDHGRMVRERWSKRLNSLNDLKNFILDQKSRLKENQEKNINSVELFFSYSYLPKDYNNHLERNDIYSNVHRGMKGLEISYGDVVKRYSPTAIIALNRSHKKVIDKFSKKYNVSQQDLQSKVKFRVFNGSHLLIFLDNKPRIYHLKRGNQLVHQSQVTKATVQAWLNEAIGFLVNSIEPNGMFRYKYRPSLRKYTGDNVVRQFMATVALGRIAEVTGRQDVWDVAERNIDFNLQKYYTKDGNFGLIEDRFGVKLGALAQAALSIIQHQKRNKWKDYEQALIQTIEHLWHEDGTLDTFYRPKHRIGEMINFSTGEGLLTMAVIYQQTKNKDLLSKHMLSYEYYKAWHFNPRNRNPAFIPWHTRSNFIIWEETKNQELVKYIFKMNDWLIEQMQSETHIYPDTSGRFYKTGNRYGPPHASATGVYLEGLIDAYRLAKAVGDKSRADNYRWSMLKGIRSLMQLQFTDESNMYYIWEENRKYVKGGIRETIYSNILRPDNTQHGLQAILKILNEFSENDFKL